MPTTVHNTENLLRDLVAAFVQHPESVVVVSQPSLDGSVYFALRGHTGDEGRLVGSGGCHVDALTFLVGLLGQVEGLNYTFRLITNQAPRQTTPLTARHVAQYDPERVRALLGRLMEELGFDNCSVTAGPPKGIQHALAFHFTIKPESARDFDLLLREVTVVIFPKTDEHPEKSVRMRLIEALGTILRAIAKHDGVRFSITAEEPKCG